MSSCDLFCLVEEPVELTSELHDVIVKQLHSVAEFRLQISRPDCQVSWLCNDSPIKEGPKYQPSVDGLEPLLKVNDVTGVDEGKYTVKVDDKTSSANLKVQGMCLFLLWASITPGFPELVYKYHLKKCTWLRGQASRLNPRP